ncbi:S-adenosyl-L-methionine-dependent methyltransferase [Choiromyces venosus 120613-1]|uniref:S-adenosyl-L-methionine-dependent methyltransferase n=1 Tax=Choiromyces venosus 120613-1 TaxID=1336337 RepID=A0A3N4J5J5_9PEZI|nr:S-adenosyl-L-methionine-dependent methyltransferase [Choiromyces venosus 120613-1]
MSRYSYSEEEEEAAEYSPDEEPSSDEEYDDNLSTMSLSDSITDYVYENGRRYHSYRQGSYVSILIVNTRYSTSGRVLASGQLTSLSEYYLPMIHSLCSMFFCFQITSAQIIGNDLSPIQPSYVPPNLRFEIDDCEEDWPFPDNHFSFVHIRNLVGSVRDWDRIYAQAYRTLKPGGWIELKDHFRPLECDNGTLKPDNVLRTWVDNFEKATNIAGISWGTAAAEFRPNLEKAGFKAVTEQIHKVPLGYVPSG